MSNSFHSAISSFSPCFIRIFDTFNEVSRPLLTIDSLNDWVYEESTHFLGQPRREFTQVFIEQFNSFMLSEGIGHWEFKFIDTTYMIVSL